MAKFTDTLFGSRPKKVNVGNYVELDLGEYESGMEDADAEMYVRIAELSNLNDLPGLKNEIYNGNMMIIDISSVKNDKLLIDRAIKDLKQFVGDVRGDIAGLGEDKLIITPSNVRVDRSKVVSGNY
ncbi:MAG: cell division protein SepF [Halobacteriota archaeon]|nr:cell division protein SepF [Halobacteriota archaeon]MDY6959561.1 cell division protein SepF [Halobacteriota archaeon]